MGRYISLERLIEQNKERYYEVLEQSSQGWHEGKHDPWPTINFLLYILTQACKEFEQRLGKQEARAARRPRSSRLLLRVQTGTFRLSTFRMLVLALALTLFVPYLSGSRAKPSVPRPGSRRTMEENGQLGITLLIRY